MPIILPFRLRVQNAIVASLQQNIAGADYNFTLTTNVFRGRNKFGSGDPIPLVSILEPPIPDTPVPVPAEVAHGNNTWPLLIQGFVDDDEENPTDPGHMLLADVKKRLAIEKERQSAGRPIGKNRNPFNMGEWRDDGTQLKSNYVEAIVSIGQGVVRPPDEGVSDKAYFWLTVVLKIQEDIGNPFV